MVALNVQTDAQKKITNENFVDNVIADFMFSNAGLGIGNGFTPAHANSAALKAADTRSNMKQVKAEEVPGFFSGNQPTSLDT